jgi:(1->4)-alpha-D-glucan 1-alpha-D-glucosylmutase
VLEWGKESPYASAFDIDWEALPFRQHPGVLLPILGRPYGDALRSGEIVVKFDSDTGSFAAWCYEQKLPINPQRYNEIIRTSAAAAGAIDEPAGKALMALAGNYTQPNSPSYQAAPEFKKHLSEISGAAAVIERGLAAYRGEDEAGAASLHRLLERQHYRVAYWRVAFAAINYRRFFDINDLAGLRIEQPIVFRNVHERIERLIADGALQGLRLDHIDGLRDPAQYAKRLKQLIRKARGKGERTPFYVVVEKILAEGETMPNFAGVAGTTGYEWLNVISHILADGAGLAPLEATWREFTGQTASSCEMLEAAKRRVVETMLASEFTVLSLSLARIAAGHFSTRDYTLNRLREALLFYVLEFPVYRTYVTAAGASAEDRATIEATIARARARWSGPDPEIFDFLRTAITLELAQDPSYSAPRVRNFALKLQQFTGPLMAKAMEDTLFYRDHRLLAFNEVGGHPDAATLPVDDFHALQRQRVETAPHSLTATATHDTKRGEDARARILALTELSGDWARAVKEWRGQNHAIAHHHDGQRKLTASHEYMIYQALIGAWPGRTSSALTARMQAYAIKAAREGKQQTSWTNPDEDYEKALIGFIAALLDPHVSRPFLTSFADFAARTSLIGALNGLSQLAFKALLPGVPDFYQGTEFWDLSLVDPDNRRAVDFAARQDGLTQDGRADWGRLAAGWQDGRIKLILTQALLRLRRQFADVFANGSYEPLRVSGPHAGHIVAFARSWKNQRLVFAVGRHFAPLTDGGRHWPPRLEATIDAGIGEFEDVLSTMQGRRLNRLRCHDLFPHLQVAALRAIL